MQTNKGKGEMVSTPISASVLVVKEGRKGRKPKPKPVAIGNEYQFTGEKANVHVEPNKGNVHLFNHGKHLAIFGKDSWESKVFGCVFSMGVSNGMRIRINDKPEKWSYEIVEYLDGKRELVIKPVRNDFADFWDFNDIDSRKEEIISVLFG